MNIKELQKLLDSSGVSEIYYSLSSNSHPKADTFGQLRVLPSGEYEVSTVERGERYDVKTFVSENDACIWFLKDGGLGLHYQKIAEYIKTVAA